MNKKEIENELSKIVGSKNIFTDEAECFCYRFGNVVEYRLNPPNFMPDFVVRPGSSEQISAILKLANKYKIPVVAWGGGTDLSGANSPIKGGILIDMKGINNIYIDKYEMTVTAGAGATLKMISEYAEKNDLLFEHEITSQCSATLGGAIATNSFGYRSGRYRTIQNLILGMEIVLPTGEIIKTKPLFKTSVGYDIHSLMVGSEGTLGIITEATLKLSPKPDKRKIFTYMFNNFEEALNYAKKIYYDIKPDFFELTELSFIKYIKHSDELLEESFNIKISQLLKCAGESYPTIMTVGFENKKEIVEIKEKYLNRIIDKSTGTVDNEFYLKRFIKYHENFRNIINLIPEISLEKYSYASFDISMPIKKLKIFVKSVHNITKNYPKVYLIDIDLYSSMSVVGLDYFVPLNNDDYSKLSKEIYKKVIELGGSLSAVHGVGTRLIPYIGDDIGRVFIEVMNKIKKAIDPNNILNPGKIGDINWKQIN